MGSFSLMHWMIVLLVVALIFGPSRLGQIGKGLGEGIRNLKRGLSDDDSRRHLEGNEASKHDPP